MKHTVNLFIFRRDLRFEDNLALMDLINSDDKVPIMPIFIFNPKQIDSSQNKYYSSNSVEFMIECIDSLNESIKNKLTFFYGSDIDILNKILNKVQVNTVAFNSDVTPFARKRDMQIKEWCFKKNIRCITGFDYTLFEPITIQTEGHTHYEVFTPFYKKCLINMTKILKPNIVPWKTIEHMFYKPNVPIIGAITNIHKYYTKNNNKLLSGGRRHALNILSRIAAKEFRNYDTTRDYPFLDKTTKLSSYLKFGCISVREAFWECVNAYGSSHGLVRELFWREFYTNISLNAPHVLQGQINGSNMTLKLKYDGMPWPSDKSHLDAWQQGKTGFPIVDAAMRCLNTTGWMHNRLRMIVAMFLTKDLLCDWRDGERYFATQLIDYDPSSNNGGWQWSASTGADAQPYFRIFNPWLQSKKFDKDCKFIKKWIPELQNVTNDDIHNWNTKHKNYKVMYPSPIVEHSQQVAKVKQLFKSYV